MNPDKVVFLINGIHDVTTYIRTVCIIHRFLNGRQGINVIQWGIIPPDKKQIGKHTTIRCYHEETTTLINKINPIFVHLVDRRITTDGTECSHDEFFCV